MGAGSGWHAQFHRLDDDSMRKQGVGEFHTRSDSQMLKFFRRILRSWCLNEDESRYLHAFKELIAFYDLSRVYRLPQIIGNCTIRGQLELFYDIMRTCCDAALAEQFQLFLTNLFAPCLTALPDADSLLQHNLIAQRQHGHAHPLVTYCYFVVSKPRSPDELRVPTLIHDVPAMIFKVPLDRGTLSWALLHNRIVPADSKEAASEDVIAYVVDTPQGQSMISITPHLSILASSNDIHSSSSSSSFESSSVLKSIEILREDCYYQIQTAIALQHGDFIIQNNQKRFKFLNSL